MTAANPVMNGDRPAPTEAGTGRMIAAALEPTTEPGVATAYPITRPDWMSWDEVEVSVNPALPEQLADVVCDWCNYLYCLASYRVDCGPWPLALDVCPACVRDVITSAAEHGRVLVETAAL